MQSLMIQAIYEEGVLKPAQPLPLDEHQKVQVAIQLVPDSEFSGNIAADPVRASYGLLGWTGDAKTVERLAMDPEFGIHESP